ncbi:hypothetical protein R6Q57_022140 [Mikania cordata]
MGTTPPHRLKQNGVISDSERILTANYTHFIILSFIFLPLCFYLITISPGIFHLCLQLLTGDHFHTFPEKLWGSIRRILMNLDQNHQNFVISDICNILIVYLLTMCAIFTISYSTHRGLISGKPVDFFPVFKSLKSSFFPIVTTAITAHSLILLFSLSFILFVQTNLVLAHNLGFLIDYNSNSFMWVSYVTRVVLIVIVAYFLVNWSLAFVIVVVESKSGLSALRRSTCLVKGMRWVSLCVFLYFGSFLGMSAWVMSDCLHAFSDWGYVLFAMTVGCGLLMSYMRHWTAATVVLYGYCLASHGEPVVDGFGCGYVGLPSEIDDEMVKV